MIEERDVIIDMSEKTEESWHQYLSEFATDVLPIFSRYGISMESAMILWELNRITASLGRLEEQFEDKI